jgi:hypothetical protein
MVGERGGLTTRGASARGRGRPWLLRWPAAVDGLAVERVVERQAEKSSAIRASGAICRVICAGHGISAREHASRNAQVGFLGALQPVCVSHEAGSPEPIGLIPGRLALSAISNACRQGMQNVYGLNVDEEHLEPVLRPRLPRSSCRQRTSDPCAARLPRPSVRELPEIMPGSQVLLRDTAKSRSCSLKQR